MSGSRSVPAEITFGADLKSKCIVEELRGLGRPKKKGKDKQSAADERMGVAAEAGSVG